MSWAVEYHDGPHRDAFYELNEPPPEVEFGEIVTGRHWNGVTWLETGVRRYWYSRSNNGGESSVTHMVFGGWLPALTPRQAECLAFIKGFIQLHDTVPSIAEISRGYGVSREQTLRVVRHLHDKGYLVANGTTLEVLG